MGFDGLSFKKPAHRPFFYTDFVSTVDGKVSVAKDGYYPIGSKRDFEFFTYLRAHADVIIDGRNSALQFGSRTIERIHNDFIPIRKKFGKTKNVDYIVLTKHDDQELKNALKNPYNFSPTIYNGSLKDFISFLNKKNHQYVFISGGPTLIASFLEEQLLDELFVTIAPKIFGNDGSTLTMVEGKLFPKDFVHLKLLSSEQVEDELFLRYKVSYNASAR